MSKRPLPTRVLVAVGVEKKKVDLVDEALLAISHPDIYVAPETLFGFSPSDRCPANATTIESILEQLEKKGIERTLKNYQKIAKALKILLKMDKIELRIYRDRVFHQTPLAFSLVPQEKK